MKMRILLKEGAKVASAETILVFPQPGGDCFETLSGERVGAEAKGILAEAETKAIPRAVNSGAKARADKYVTAKDLLADLKWLHKALGHFELGSEIGLKLDRGLPALDLSEANKLDRAEGLAEGHQIAIGPAISPQTFMNAHGEVVSIDGDTVVVKLDPGDRDRIRRATGKQLSELEQFPLACVERLT